MLCPRNPADRMLARGVTGVQWITTGSISAGDKTSRLAGRLGLQKFGWPGCFFIPGAFHRTFRRCQKGNKMADLPHHEIIVESGPLVKLFIDGRRLQVNPRMTILEAAHANGIEIPTLCNDPRLAPVGNCGLCLVEVVETGLVYACQTPVAEGMEVTTLNPEIAEVRKQRLTEYLTSHNAYCEPPCHNACPARIDIPAYLAAIARGMTPKPSGSSSAGCRCRGIIGRVCPRPCETPAAVPRLIRNRWPSAS